MKAHRYYVVTGMDKQTNAVASAIVLAENPTRAKTKFIHGETIPYFEGWDNSEWPYAKLKAHRLKSLSYYQPNNTFSILKALILEEGWTFNSVDDNHKYLDKNNFSPVLLKHYIDTGTIN